MIKNLIAAAMASILITQPPQNANDGTYYQDVNITESYEYETNEVNTTDDLVLGNIYKIQLTNAELPNETLNSNYLRILVDDEIKTILENDNYDLYSGATYTVVQYTGGNQIWTYRKADITTLTIYFIYTGLVRQPYFSHLTASDYLGEKTITIEPVETEGLYNLAYHFLYSRIYTNTELQTMETTLFGTTINMNMWLSHTTAIVIICLLLVVLIKFILWLFKIVSGGMLWK